MSGGKVGNPSYEALTGGAQLDNRSRLEERLHHIENEEMRDDEWLGEVFNRKVGWAMPAEDRLPVGVAIGGFRLPKRGKRA